MVEEKIPIYIPDYEAKQFIVFQKHYHAVLPLLDYLEKRKINEFKSVSITMDIDDVGIVKHTAVTHHFR